MMKGLRGVLVLALLAVPCLAVAQSPSLPDSSLSAGATSAAEPEEPDFAFIAGGPYTQKQGSIQFILPSQWGRRKSNVAGGILQHAEFGTLLRTEWGLTDRWELDVIFSAEGERDFLGHRNLTSTFALADAVLGARYRLLQESSAPFTLAVGPQIILPSGNPLLGTGNERVGYALDVAAAKDWGGPAFLYTSLNYSIFPSVRAPIPGSARGFNLQHVFWATALGLRPLEKDRGTSHHDIHLFLESGLGREESLERESPIRKVSETLAVFAPGIRYGFLTRTKKLFEIGVSFPIGLNHNTPRGGIIVQVQFEHLFGFRGE